LRGAVNGRNEIRDLALELLIAEGYARVVRDGRADLHHSVKRFRADDEGRRAVVDDAALFEPNGSATCDGCGARLTPVVSTGRLVCMDVDCPSKPVAA